MPAMAFTRPTMSEYVASPASGKPRCEATVPKPVMYKASKPKVSASRSETMSYTPGAITSPGWVRRWRKEMGAGMEGLEEGADSDMVMERCCKQGGMKAATAQYVPARPPAVRH